MTAVARNLIAEATRHGVVMALTARGTVKLSAPNAPPPELLIKLRSHRDEIKDYLRRPAVAVATHNLSAWAEGVSRLNPARPPQDVPLPRWQQFVDDCGRFLDAWASKASALGWEQCDLFGAHPAAPWQRIDYLGLLWLLNGNRIVLLGETTAVIEMSDGARQTYRRRPIMAGRVLAWELP